MSSTTDQSTVDHAVESEPFVDPSGFMELVTEMVADQAPRVFAVVVEFGEHLDAQIVSWGMAFDEGAWMTTVDGRNQYALAEPENALKYVRNLTNAAPHLVWVDRSSELGIGQDQSESSVQRDQLRRWREQAGLTQQELADVCGLSRFQISRWETGEARPAPGSLKPLVRGLMDVLNAPFALADLLEDSSAE